MNNENVVVRGSKNGVKFYVERSDEWERVIEEICEYSDKIRGLFLYNSTIEIITDQPPILTDRISLEQELYRTLGDEVNIVFDTKKDICVKDEFYFGNLRSGQQKCSSGNLCIVGDVNPGAELRAGGNIVVLGVLKGKAYAGMSGNRSAVIAAMNFCATQIAIADIICRAPESECLADRGAEIAFVKNEQICIDSYMSKKLIY